MTLRQAEEETGLSKDTISRIERGLRNPQPLTTGKLAEAYGHSIEEFLEAPKVQSPQLEEEAAAGESIDYRQMYLELGKQQIKFVDEMVAEVADVLTTEDYEEFVKLPIDEQRLRIETAERLNALAVEMLESIEGERTDELTRRRERLNATSAAIREFKKTA
jgi:transcriptional regulator with XRE-family HTH domain